MRKNILKIVAGVVCIGCLSGCAYTYENGKVKSSITGIEYDKAKVTSIYKAGKNTKEYIDSKKDVE